MDKSERDQIALSIEQTYRGIVEAAVAQRSADLASLDRVFELSAGKGTGSQDSPANEEAEVDPDPDPHPDSEPEQLAPLPPANRRVTGPATPTTLIRHALPEMRGEFTNSKIRVFIHQRFGQELSAKEAASAINKMFKRGEIRVIRHGKPNYPAIYSGRPKE